eukprot:m.339032 g.339032  ORF g.339032 m.339032 type:complete len:64 (+) comp20574_c0_seq1:252-443(+)
MVHECITQRRVSLESAGYHGLLLLLMLSNFYFKLVHVRNGEESDVTLGAHNVVCTTFLLSLCL